MSVVRPMIFLGRTGEINRDSIHYEIHKHGTPRCKTYEDKDKKIHR